MSDFVDHLPSQEREKIRKKMRSPEAYERLREKVKGPEDLENEMEKNDRMAEMRFALESEPHMKEKIKSHIEKDMKEQGIENVLESEKISKEDLAKIAEGKFTLAISNHPATHEDAMVVIPEGNVQEKIPVKVSFTEKYSASLHRS